MNFDIHVERAISPNIVDFRVEAWDKKQRIAAFYVRRVDTSKGYLNVLQQIAEQAPKCCNDFTVTHTRWNNEGTPYQRRISEWIEHCPHHIGIGFPAYHVSGTKKDDDRMFECTYCGCVFPESQGIEVDSR